MGLFFKSAPVHRTIFSALFKITFFSTDRGTFFWQSAKTAVNMGNGVKKCFRKSLGPPNFSHFWVLKNHLILSFTRSVEKKTIESYQSLRFCDMYAIQRVKCRWSPKDPWNQRSGALIFGELMFTRNLHKMTPFTSIYPRLSRNAAS